MPTIQSIIQAAASPWGVIQMTFLADVIGFGYTGGQTQRLQGLHHDRQC